MDNFIRAGMLADIYGTLLTEKQMNTLSLLLHDDCSLQEIAEKSGVSRQAAHDIIKRSINLLEHYEEKLGIYAKLVNNRKQEGIIKQMLKQNKIEEALVIINKIVEI